MQSVKAAWWVCPRLGCEAWEGIDAPCALRLTSDLDLASEWTKILTKVRVTTTRFRGIFSTSNIASLLFKVVLCE